MNLNSKHARALTNTLEIKLYPKTTSWGSLVISPNPTNLLLWPLPLKGRLISPLMQQQWNVPWNAVIGVLSLNGIRSQYACSRFVKTTSQQRLEASSFLFKSKILNVNTKITRSDYQSVCVHFCHFDSAVLGKQCVNLSQQQLRQFRSPSYMKYKSAHSDGQVFIQMFFHQLAIKKCKKLARPLQVRINPHRHKQTDFTINFWLSVIQLRFSQWLQQFKAVYGNAQRCCSFFRWAGDMWATLQKSLHHSLLNKFTFKKRKESISKGLTSNNTDEATLSFLLIGFLIHLKHEKSSAYNIFKCSDDWIIFIVITHSAMIFGLAFF